jgi:hypothetical protein
VWPSSLAIERIMPQHRRLYDWVTVVFIKALGPAILPSVRARADEVVE